MVSLSWVRHVDDDDTCKKQVSRQGLGSLQPPEGLTRDLATILGAGIVPEVVEQALRALRAAADAEGGQDVRVTEYPLGVPAALR